MGCRGREEEGGGGIIGSGSLGNGGEMGELVMMFPTRRSFYCRKTDGGQTLAEPDAASAATTQPSVGAAGFGGLQSTAF